VYFNADEQISSHSREFQKRVEDRNYMINHLNQSLFYSSPQGRLISYIKAFLERYVELKD